MSFKNQPTFNPLVPVKRAYDILFMNVDPKKDHQKNLTFAEMRSLRENQQISKPFKPFQAKPSESKSNTLFNVAAPVNAPGTAPVINQVNDDDDSEATPPPPPPPRKKNTPPHPFVDPKLLNLEPTPEDDQTKPPSPTPEADQTKPPSPPPEAGIQKSPEPDQQQKPNSEPNSVTVDKNLTVETIEKSPQHVAMDNTFTVIQPNNSQLQEISNNLDSDQTDKSPPHSSAVNNLMDDLSHECIYVPPHLPSKILNEPISTTQDDITLLLQAVNKNIRRLNFAIPNISVESAHIDQECDLMQNGIHSMIEAIREAYKEELKFRKEMTRLEVERIEREKREVEERERKRIEDEKIEKERQEAMEREQARLAEEARKATEQARLEDFARNAPEFALKMREDQNDIKKIVSEHTTLFAKMFATLQSIEARLPPPSPQP
ncbi:hypothetical protein QL285_015023 [Trifolium repens]|nr:hypothetical protein QL285_015023 [Trifolium repens]